MASLIGPTPVPTPQLGLGLQRPPEKSYEDTPGNVTLETLLNRDVEAGDAREAATEYLEIASRKRVSQWRLGRAAKEIVKIATLQASEDSDPDAYDEAIASGLIEPYQADIRSDRIAMAKIMARDIVEGRAKLDAGGGIRQPLD